MYFRESYQPLEQEPQTGQALYAPWLQPSHVLAREFSQEMEVSLLDDVDNADQHHKFIEICPPCLMPPPYPATEERDDPVSVFARRWVSRQLYLSSRVIAPSIPRLVETEMDSFEREIPGLDSGPLTLHLPNAEAPIHLTSSCGAYRKRWINPRRYFPGLPGLDLFPDPNDATSEMLLNEEPTHALPRETPVRLASSSVIVPASGSAPPTIRSSARPSSIFSSQSSTQFATPSSSQVQAVHQSTPVQRIGLLPSSQMTSSQLTSSQATPSQMPSSQFSVASSQRRLNSQQQQQSKSKGKARKKGF